MSPTSDNSEGGGRKTVNFKSMSHFCSPDSPPRTLCLQTRTPLSAPSPFEGGREATVLISQLSPQIGGSSRGVGVAEATLSQNHQRKFNVAPRRSSIFIQIRPYWIRGSEALRIAMIDFFLPLVRKFSSGMHLFQHFTTIVGG